MAKTEVILTHNIIGLGGESDQVRVAAGYARNYLFPRGLAIPTTAANKRRLEALRQRRGEREAHELNTMSELAKSLAKMTLVVTVKTGEDGKMFGSVTSGTIADELHKQFEVHLEKRKIHLEHPIRTLGDHDVEMRLHTDVHINLKVRVLSSTPAPAVAETAPANARTSGPPKAAPVSRGASKSAPEPAKAEASKADAGKSAAKSAKKPASEKKPKA